MNRAQLLGRWFGQILRPHNRTKLIALLAAGFILIVLAVAEIQRPRVVSDPKFVPRVSTKTRAEIEADQARAEAERQAEAARQRQADLQREIERQQAQEKFKQSVRDSTNRAIKACVSIVRQRSEGRYYKSAFDAYATGEYAESIRFFGTPEEHFQFEKCMAERGHPLSATSTDSKGKKRD